MVIVSAFVVKETPLISSGQLEIPKSARHAKNCHGSQTFTLGPSMSDLAVLALIENPVYMRNVSISAERAAGCCRRLG
jgi:hypothetical protein